MKTNLIMGLTLVAAIIVAAGCQSTEKSNAAPNTNTNTMPVHDMSNMNGMSNMSHDMTKMNDHDMTNINSDPGAAAAPYDLQFLDSMIHHHNGAISMAKMVLGKSDRPELKAFAQKIIDDQTKEMAVLQQLRSQWFAGKPSAVNMEMPGMVGGMKMMNGEHMKEMDEMDPKHFDAHFLKMMIAHHEGAVTMSKEVPKKAEHPEIKKLAEGIISAQQPEIDQMKKWQAVWEK